MIDGLLLLDVSFVLGYFIFWGVLWKGEGSSGCGGIGKKGVENGVCSVICIVCF